MLVLVLHSFIASRLRNLMFFWGEDLHSRPSFLSRFQPYLFHFVVPFGFTVLFSVFRVLFLLIVFFSSCPLPILIVPSVLFLFPFHNFPHSCLVLLLFIF